MSIESDVIWMDGEWVDFEDATVHVLTHSLHYGLGAFEGIRCYRVEDGRGAFFRLSDHVRRLFDTAAIGGIDIPWEPERIEEVCRVSAVRNGFESSYVRPIVFLGHGEMGLGATGNEVRTAVACWEWGAYLGDDGLENGIRAKISSFERPGVDAAMVKGKLNGQYVNSILAKREARELGFDEAILLDPDGYVSEASGENVFAVRDGSLYTAPDTGSILAGITRDTIVTLAEEMEREVVERRFTRDFLYTADEVFMTGTAAEVTPVREVDGRTIGDGTPGPVTQRLKTTYFDHVEGRADAHEEWRTYVDLE